MHAPDSPASVNSSQMYETPAGRTPIESKFFLPDLKKRNPFRPRGERSGYNLAVPYGLPSQLRQQFEQSTMAVREEMRSQLKKRNLIKHHRKKLEPSPQKMTDYVDATVRMFDIPNGLSREEFYLAAKDLLVKHPSKCNAKNSTNQDLYDFWEASYTNAGWGMREFTRYAEDDVVDDASEDTDDTEEEDDDEDEWKIRKVISVEELLACAPNLSQ